MAESGGRETSGRLRSPDSVDSSAGQRERENPGIAGHSFIFCPSRCASLHGSVAPLSLSRLRRCLPRLERGRGGARGGAGARSARRAWGEGSWRCAPSSACSTEAPPPASQPLSELGDLSRPPLLTSLPTRPHAQPPVLPQRPPTPLRWGWGKGAASSREGEKSSLTGWAAREQEKKLFTPAPRVWSPTRAPSRPPRVGTAPEARARAQAQTLGGRGKWWREGYVHRGFGFSLRLSAARGQGERATSHWRPHPDFPPAGGWTLCSLLPRLRV